MTGVAWAIKKRGFSPYPNTVSVSKSGSIDRFMANHAGGVVQDGDRDKWHRLRDKNQLEVVRVAVNEINPL